MPPRALPRALTAATLLVVVAVSALPLLAQPTWLEGCWERRTTTSVTHEQWRRTPAGLDGGAATWRGDTLVAWEILRLDTSGRAPRYVAAPSGQPAHAFPVLAATKDSLHVADPSHDFPQHIVYRRLGTDSLLALVYGTDANRAQRLAFARAACEPAHDLTRATALRDALQAALDSIHALGTAPGLSAAVALPDGRTITVTSGLADSAGAVPLLPTHRLLAGSTGKTFFAALALQLAARDSLDLHAPISRWLGNEPWFARLPNGAHITVRQLMNHTSGLVRYEFTDAFARDLAADPLRAWTVPEQLAYILGQPAPFAAGTDWQYSDTNYLVLGLILERILGGLAYDAITQRFLTPFRLRGTVPARSPAIPQLANGYIGPQPVVGLAGTTLQGGALVVNPQFEWAGGGFASTPEDLARWAQRWYTGQAFPAPLLAQALDGVSSASLGAGVRYGLGVFVRESASGVSYDHSGFFPGYRTEMRFWPASGVAVSVMTNTSLARAIGTSPGAIAEQLAAIATAHLATEPPR
jgi:D-alanyl-D-alanine carboxypeptidase